MDVQPYPSISSTFTGRNTGIKMLTDLAIRKMKPREKLYRQLDSDGLYIEVSTTGLKYWRYRYNLAGRDQLYSIGRYPDITLAQARKIRDEKRVVVSQGKQLTREKRKEKRAREAADSNTFESVAIRFMETKKANLNAKYHKQSLERLKQHVFPAIGQMPVTEITIPDIVDVVEAIASKGTIETAKRMKQRISEVFRYAAQRGLCAYNPASDLRDILPTPEKQHHACIPVSELPELLQRMEAMPEGLGKYAMHIKMLTILRTRELIEGKWAEIDWQRCEWVVPKERMKTRRPHTVPLSSQAIDLLKRLHKETGHTENLFFSSASKSKHISDGTILMALRRMGYQGRMTGHGFRSLCSTVLNEQGYPSDVVEAQLAHIEGDRVRAAYNRAQYMLKRKAMI